MLSQLLLQVLILVSVLPSPGSVEHPQDRSTYDEVLAGMQKSKNTRGDIEHNYRAGQSLHFAIVGLGKTDASVYFYSASFEGDYFAVVNILDECVVVRPGQKAAPTKQTDLAFVSIRNGKVYQTIEELRKKK